VPDYFGGLGFRILSNIYYVGVEKVFSVVLLGIQG